MSLKCASLLAIFTVASAGPVSQAEDGGFQGNSLVKAGLSFLCIYAFLYLIITVLCEPKLLRTPRQCLGVYIALFLSLSFATISTVVSVFVLMVKANRTTDPDSSKGNIISALLTLTLFFNSWSFPLLILSSCMLVRVCQSSLYEARLPIVLPMVYYLPFALLTIVGTAVMGLYIDQLSFLYIKDCLAGQTVAWIEDKVAIYHDPEYTLLSLWLLSAVITLSYTAFIYSEARRLSLNDKVLWIALFGVTPAYILLAMEEMISTILTSPPGVKINPLTNVIQFESIEPFSFSLASTILFAFIVAVEVSRKPSHAGSEDKAPR